MKILIAGGAGFIGSNLAAGFAESGHEVTVIDGLMKGTGASVANLKACRSHISFIKSRVEKIRGLSRLLARQDAVIDSMAFTFHRKALENPRYDLELNAKSHLYLIEALRAAPKPKVVYLGSRGQYGNPRVPVISEDTICEPVDIQGTHKQAGEAYYRIYAKLWGLRVISLRLSNCFGENQSLAGSETGLIGDFLRNIYTGETIEIYGDDRARNLIYVKDLLGVIDRLFRADFKGFEAFNYGGHRVSISEIARLLIDIAGRGRCVKKEMPPEVKAIDVGNAEFDDAKLRRRLGAFDETNLRHALERTVRYYEGKYI